MQYSSDAFPTYTAFAEALQRTNRISDPWLDGKERFRIEPVVLTAQEYRRLCEAAERIGALYDELCGIVLNNPQYLDFFSLTPYERLMWYASGGEWHGIARLDLFLLPDGSVRTCEMNSDTPSGEAEAVLLNEILFPHHSPLHDPNTRFIRHFVEMIQSFLPKEDRNTAKSAPKRLGIVFPTEQPEDLSMILCYEEWLCNAGFEVVIGAPYNLHLLQDGSAAMFDMPIDILLRHYKTDWWAERESVWLDGIPFPDPDPLHREIAVALEASSNGRLRVVNPFGAVLTQNKLTMAFFHAFPKLFSAFAQETIQRYIPKTQRLCDAQEQSNFDEILHHREKYVLKSDYGCEGDEVILGRGVSEDIWECSLREAIPTRWIVQEFFEAAPTADGFIPNYGVYLLGGVASGIYTRLAPLQTDYRALSAATFIVDDIIGENIMNENISSNHSMEHH
jgi:glutathionylspermidine synthase